MARTFRPPFRIELNYKRFGKHFEWHESWGKPPHGVSTIYNVEDFLGQIVSTSRTRKYAEASLAGINEVYHRDVQDGQATNAPAN